ncbi:MAG: MFS transporter, partial [Actinomycetota bacterium]
PDPFVLIGARSIQAAGGALLTPASMTLILTTFAPERRAMAVGAWGAVGGVATAIGPSIGAALIELGGWRATFLLNVVLAVALWVWGRRILDESVDPEARRLTDLVGSGLIVVAVGSVALATVQGPEWGWTDPRTIGAAAIGAVCAGGVVVRSRHHPEPVLDLALFRVATFRQSNLVALTFSAAFFAMFFGLVLFLTDGWGYDTPKAGLLITPGPVAAAVFSIMGGRVADRRGHRAVMVPGTLAFAAGAAWLLVAAGDEPALLTVWLPAMVLMGTGIGLVFPSFQSAAVHGVPSTSFGVASAAVQTNVRIAATLGVAAAVALLAETGPGSAVAEFDPLFVMLVGLALV